MRTLLASGTAVGLGSLLLLLAGCGGDNPAPEPLIDTAAAATPALDLTSLPPLNTAGSVSGRAYNVVAADHAVVVYIYVGGWWVKPYAAAPVTPLGAGGTFTCDIVTGGDDAAATRLAAFLIPKTYAPPVLLGAPHLPPALYANAVAHTMWDRTTTPARRLVEFAGYLWTVKASTEGVGPGPNLFSDSGRSVWVDSQGRLHLKIRREGGVWKCAEVVCYSHCGYGQYVYSLDSSVDRLDRNVVLGLFTWSDSAAYTHRELDIEFAHFGDPLHPNASYSVQPWETAGHHHDFAMPSGRSAHSFTWQEGKVFFKSVRGHVIGTTDPALIVQKWTSRAAPQPVPGNETPRLNLWLFGGSAPTNGLGVEIVVKSFRFRAR